MCSCDCWGRGHQATRFIPEFGSAHEGSYPRGEKLSVNVAAPFQGLGLRSSPVALPWHSPVPFCAPPVPLPPLSPSLPLSLETSSLLLAASCLLLAVFFPPACFLLPPGLLPAAHYLLPASCCLAGGVCAEIRALPNSGFTGVKFSVCVRPMRVVTSRRKTFQRMQTGPT